MKRLKLFCIALLICGVFTACSGQITPESLDLDKAFTFTARIEYGGSVSAAEFKRTDSGVWEGVLTEPYALQGIKIGFAPQGMTVSYSDFAVRYDPSSPPDINIAAFLLFGAVEKAIGAEQSDITVSRDFIEVKGIFDGDNFVLRLDKDAVLLSLEIPGLQLKAEFSDVRSERIIPSDLVEDFEDIERVEESIFG